MILVVGMLASKDCEGFLRNFAGLARRLIAVPVPGAEKGMLHAAGAVDPRGNEVTLADRFGDHVLKGDIGGGRYGRGERFAERAVSFCGALQ